MNPDFGKDIDINPHLMKVFDEFFIPLIMIDGDTRLLWHNALVQEFLEKKQVQKLKALVNYGLFDRKSYQQIEKFLASETDTYFPSKINTDFLLLPLKKKLMDEKKVYLLFLPYLSSKKTAKRNLHQPNEYLNLLVPTQFPEIRGLQFSQFYQPNSSFGGDIYNVIKVNENKIAFFIADVSGFGLSASLQAMIFKKLLEKYFTTSEAPPVIMEKLNRTLFENIDTDDFITVFIGVLDLKNGCLHFTNAGHPFPLLFRDSENKIEELDSGGFFVGIMEDGNYGENQVTLGHKDKLLLYTDGIIEAKNGEYRLFGKRRLRSVFKQAVNQKFDGDVILQTIMKALQDHTRQQSADDDRMLLLIERRYKI
jgi:serine phosphatase RsbU (regulator of sigma subunit)